MLRLLQTADLRLGGRHPELGDRGAALRERRLEALEAIVSLALAEHVELVLIAGNLFASNAVSRRVVEVAARILGRLAAAGIAVAVLPGPADADELDSLYRAHDLAALSGVPGAADLIATLTAARPAAAFPRINAVVGGLVPPTRERRPARGHLFDPLAQAIDSAGSESGLQGPWRIGVAAGWPAGFGAPDDARVFSEDEIASTPLDLLALGGPDRAASGAAASTRWTVPGAPELVDIHRNDPGSVSLVSLDRAPTGVTIEVAERAVAKLRVERLAVDVAKLPSQEELVARLAELHDPNRVLLVEMEGTMADQLDVDRATVEEQLADRFFAVRVTDASVPEVPSESPFPIESVPGVLWHEMAERVRAADARGDDAAALELRRAFRLVRRRFAGLTPSPGPRGRGSSTIPGVAGATGGSSAAQEALR